VISSKGQIGLAFFSTGLEFFDEPVHSAYRLGGTLRLIQALLSPVDVPLGTCCTRLTKRRVSSARFNRSTSLVESGDVVRGREKLVVPSSQYHTTHIGK
jgi:hypothetical protein